MTGHAPLKAAGYTGTVEFDGNSITIQHNWRGKFGGWKDPHVIDLQRIREVLLSAASVMTNGNLNLVVPGEVQIDGATSKNIVIFTKKQQPAFAAIHDALQSALASRGPMSPEAEARTTEQRPRNAQPTIYGQFVLADGSLGFNASGHRHVKPVGGASAVFDSGAEQSRPTLTRIGAGALLAGPIGAVGGALLKKNTSKCYVTVVFADGDSVIIEGPVKDESQLRAFAASINQMSSQATR